jgi:hypothetical protein
LKAQSLTRWIAAAGSSHRLSDSRAKSMVGERRPVSIKVQATSGRAVSSEAVSLGLIVTELVINALKRGFPSGATGEILVSYELGALAGAYRYRTTAQGLETLMLRGHTPVSARALLKRWPVNSMPLCRNPVAPRGRRFQLLQAQPAGGRNDCRERRRR